MAALAAIWEARPDAVAIVSSAIRKTRTHLQMAWLGCSARIARRLGVRHFTASYFERRFSLPDPWGFASREYELKKYEHTLDAIPDRHYEDILEIACAEGLFTQSLADLGSRVLGTDISTRALTRARTRLVDRAHVRFKKADIFTDPIADTFDLVVASEVLCYAESRRSLAAAIERLADCLNTGGYLVLVNLRISTEYHKGWPPGDLLFGADTIHCVAIDRAELQLLAEYWEENYAISVFRRQD